MPRLLGHVVSLLTSQRENAATEALAFILGSRTARDALSTALAGAYGAPVAIDRVATQEAVGEESRPDLVAYDADGRGRCFIEAKLWAGLTDAQPTEYIRRLQEQDGQVLLFVVPKTRVEPILAELRGRALAKRVMLSEWEQKGTFRLARCGDRQAVLVTSWQALLGALRLACSQTRDEDALADLAQLEGLIEQFVTEGFVPLSPSELSDLEAPRRIVSLINVVERGTQAALAAGILSNRDAQSKLLKETSGRYSGGRYVAFPQAVCWMGVDMETWLQLQVSPAWVFFYGTQCAVAAVRTALREWGRSSSTGLFSYKNADIAVPLLIRPGADEDAVVADLVRQIRAIADALACSGLPAGPRSTELPRLRTGEA